MCVVLYKDGTKWWKHSSCRCCRQNGGAAGSRPHRWHIKDESSLCPMNVAAKVLLLFLHLAPDIISDCSDYRQPGASLKLITVSPFRLPTPTLPKPVQSVEKCCNSFHNTVGGRLVPRQRSCRLFFFCRLSVTLGNVFVLQKKKEASEMEPS